MRDDGVGLPLSRRVPGAARPGPGQSAQAALPEDLLTRMQAAVDAEHAQADVHNHGEPNTEPLPCVTESGATSKAGRRPASQTGIGPGIEAPPDQVAESAFAAPPPLEELPLRVAKALRAAPVAEDLGADEPELVRAAEPEAVRGGAAAEPEPVWAAESQPPAEAAYPPPAEPPRRTRPAAAPTTTSHHRARLAGCGMRKRQLRGEAARGGSRGLDGAADQAIAPPRWPSSGPLCLGRRD